MAEYATCNIYMLMLLFHRSAYGIPILQPASEGEAVCGEFSELFKMKEKALHLLHAYSCVGLQS